MRTLLMHCARTLCAVGRARLLLVLALALGTVGIHAADTAITVVQMPGISMANPFYPGNRAPLQPSPLIKLPIGAIVPNGWLKRQLELDASGMCGNLPQVSDFVKPGCAWASPTGEGHHPWEEPVYWLRGYGDLGYVLNDATIISNARCWIEAMIASRQPDGYFGPRELKVREKGKPESWPHYLAVNVLRSYYEYTNDKRVIDLLTGYFKWVSSLQDEDLHRSGLDNIRAVEQIANVYWLYNRTGNTWLLELAKRIHTNTANWLNNRPTGHNVDFAMSFREPAEYWQQAGTSNLLAATRARYDEVMREFGQFPGGGFAGDENISGAVDPRQGLETCGFAEFMHSFQILTRIDADPLWADRCEEIAFNSFPASMTPDHKGLHYVTCANMVSDDFRNRRITFCNGWVKTGYSPTVGSGTSAHAWIAAKIPLTASFRVTASFTRESQDAVNDGMEPARSGDGGVPRMTWWDHKGTAEWLQYKFDTPRTVSVVSVYWFDDSSHGGCKVPASWKLLYLHAGKWEPVVLDKGQWKALDGEQHYGTKKDEYNTLRFKPVVADSLRIEVQLQPNYSAGVLEWKVGE